MVIKCSLEIDSAFILIVVLFAMQMNRIKNNCSIQVEWMKENYMEFVKNAPPDHHSSHLSAQYNQQVGTIDVMTKLLV